MNKIKTLLFEDRFDQETLAQLLQANPCESVFIYEKAAKIKEKYIGSKVYLRGLIELSNKCSKNCYYCGIRRGNMHTERYALSEEEIEEAVHFAINKNLGSIVIQSGELFNEQFICRIEKIIQKAKKLSSGKLGITLSCGEQEAETYRRWYAAGAHRYLLRIESSDRKLYYKIHPDDAYHNFENRLSALQNLKKSGFQTGTGVMIGLPFQTIEHLAADLLFMREMDIDMCGMGPYVEHEHTPLYQYRNILKSKKERVDLSLKMIALLRIMMKDINIASTTALQALDPNGRTKALQAGANILMPNITPGVYRNKYALYNNKPGIDENAENSRQKLETMSEQANCQISYGEWGDSSHFLKKTNILNGKNVKLS